jgi:hypothetical protein
MATYIYETIPQAGTDSPRRFEVVQSMKDAPLTRHPDTGEPVRRVISGGYGIMSKPQASSFKPSAAAPAGCSPGCACHAAPRVPAL